MNKQILLLVSILAFSANSIFAQNSIPKAPEILFSVCLNNNELKNGFNKNKFVVLDFWATWCGPCIASFPHLDSLSKKFSSDSVVFAIISSEEKGKVARFLKDRNIKAYHLLDSISDESKSKTKVNDLHGITAQNFKVVGIPHTVIIDKDNNLVWQGTASDLTAIELQKILKGNSNEVYEKKQNELASLQAKQLDNAKIFTQLKKDTLQIGKAKLITAIVPYETMMMRAGKINEKGLRFVQIESYSLTSLYSYFSGLPLYRIHSDIQENIFLRYENDMDLDMQTFKLTALRLLAKAQNARYIKKTKLIDAYVVEIKDKNKFDLKTRPLDPNSKHSSFSPNETELVYANVIFNSIIADLDNFLKQPILIEDEELKNTKISMIVDKGSFKELNSSLNKEYGINLKKVKRAIEFVDIVRK